MRRSQLKLAAVVGLVVLVLSGFAPTKRGGGDGGDGGGCGKDGGSSSSSNGGSGTDDGSTSGTDGSSTTSTGGTTGGGNARPRTSITECVGQSGNSATVRVTAPSGLSRTYTLRVSFLDETGDLITNGEQKISIGGGETRTVTVTARDSTLLDQVTECRLEPVR